MSDRGWLWLRGLFLAGFTVALPLFAYPPLTRWADAMLYGPPKSIVPPLAGAPLAGSAAAAVVRAGETSAGVSPAGTMAAGPPRDFMAGIDAPARLPEPPPARNALASAALDVAQFGGNPLAPGSAAQPLALPTGESPIALLAPQPSAMPLGGQLPEARLQEIRQRLEDLGAKSLVLEMTAGDARYRFWCEMFVAPRSPETQSFEAVTESPLGAAEQVLREVSAWRVAQRTPNTNSSLR